MSPDWTFWQLAKLEEAMAQSLLEYDEAACSGAFADRRLLRPELIDTPYCGMLTSPVPYSREILAGISNFSGF
jgi:hypothetical protein